MIGLAALMTVGVIGAFDASARGGAKEYYLMEPLMRHQITRLAFWIKHP